jgi:hypothetical protein
MIQLIPVEGGKTIGVVEVALFAARIAVKLPAAITSAFNADLEVNDTTFSFPLLRTSSERRGLAIAPGLFRKARSR